jgi:hypothetical protein
MSYYLRFYSKDAQSFICSGHIDTLVEAMEQAKEELASGADAVEVRKSATNELMATVETITKTENHV